MKAPIFLFIVIVIATTVSAAALQSPALRESYPRYRLQPGDVLDLIFPLTPEFNQTVIVQPDGYVNLRGAGDLRVLHSTTSEIMEGVRAAYGKVLHDPVITIGLKEFEKPYFIVGGEVAHPGKYDLRGDTTVVQAVQIAGGPAEKSKKQVLLFRRVSEEWVEVTKIDIKRILSGKDITEDVQLRSGDMILVPRTALSKMGRFIPTPTLGMYLKPFPF